MPILSASSPVEIEVQADLLGLHAAARAAALALFHDLTSQEELAALTLPEGGAGTRDGGEWPAHRFLFGPAAEVAAVLAALRAQPDAAELGTDDAPEGFVPGTLFLAGEREGFGGVLLACSGPGRLEEISAEVLSVATHR